MFAISAGSSDTLKIKYWAQALRLLQTREDLPGFYRDLCSKVLNKWGEGDCKAFIAARQWYRDLDTVKSSKVMKDRADNSIAVFGRLGCVNEVVEVELELANRLSRLDVGQGPADETFEKALRLCLQTGNLNVENDVRICYARFLTKGANYRRALEVLGSLKTETLSSCYSKQAYYLHANLGSNYWYLNLYETASVHFEEADSIAAIHSRLDDRIYPLSMYGQCLTKRGRYSDASRILEQSAAISRLVANSLQYAWAQLYRADLAMDCGDTANTRLSLHEALKIFESSDDKDGQSNAKYRLGRLDRAAHRTQSAIDSQRDALALSEDPRKTVYYQKELGLALLEDGQIAGADSILRSCGDLLQEVQRSASPSALSREYLNDKLEITEALIKISMARRNWAEAFNIAEQFRARSLYRITAEKQSVDALQHGRLREVEQEIESIIASIRTCGRNESDGDLSVEKLDFLFQESDDNLLFAQPVANRNEGIPSTYEDFVRTPQESELRLYYFAFESTLICWYAGGGLSGFYDLSKSAGSNDSLLSVAIKYLGRPPILETDRKRLDSALSSLSILLPPEVQNQLSSGTRLVIFPQGKLCYFPFESIRLNERYVGEYCSVEYNYSLSLFLRHRRSTRAARVLKTAAIFGGSFSEDRSQCTGSSTETLDAYRQLESLHAARSECTVVEGIFGSTKSDYFDLADQESIFRDVCDRDFDILHFATHGLLFDDASRLSGLVFPFDGVSRKHDDVLLVDEISRCRIKASLVFLSACQTALGRYVEGEGLIGLTQAFVGAGARSVVSSLWSIDDVATSEYLVRPFYDGIRSGLSTAEALRLARLNAIQSKDYSHPFYWAAFVAIGDWR